MNNPILFENTDEAIAYWEVCLCNLERKITPLLRERREIINRINFLHKKKGKGLELDNFHDKFATLEVQI